MSDIDLKLSLLSLHNGQAHPNVSLPVFDISQTCYSKSTLCHVCGCPLDDITEAIITVPCRHRLHHRCLSSNFCLICGSRITGKKSSYPEKRMGRNFDNLRIESRKEIIQALETPRRQLPASMPLPPPIKTRSKLARTLSLSSLRSPRSRPKTKNTYLARPVIPIQPCLSIEVSAESAYVPSQGGPLMAMISLTANYPSDRLPIRLGLDAVILWDISDSISPFFSYSKHVLRQLLTSFNDCDTFGIMTYGPTMSSEIFKPAFATDEVKDMAVETIEGTTASLGDRPGLDRAIRKAIERLNTSRVSNHRYSSIFILTDGNDEFIEHDASRHGISIFSLGIGALQNDPNLFKLSRSGAHGGAYINCDELEALGHVCHYASAGVGFEPFQNIQLEVLLEEGFIAANVITSTECFLSDTIMISKPSLPCYYMLIKGDLAPFETVRVFLQVQVSPTTQLQTIFAEINEMLDRTEEPILAAVIKMSYTHPALPTITQNHEEQELYIYRSEYQIHCTLVTQKYLERVVFLSVQATLLRTMKWHRLENAKQQLKWAEDTLQTRGELCHWVSEMREAVKAARDRVCKTSLQLGFLKDENEITKYEFLDNLSVAGNTEACFPDVYFQLEDLPSPHENDSRIGSYYFNDPAQYVWLGMEKERRGLL
ncbi:hypothetical protein NEOLI_001476 [Neolecta irregularis DAH-3]|uniref:VWFA domain-containing protein n=1 Tax=Neolecta irregularis (strain DAH-3) TaxID=1198029 RepID=A0A1U7LUF5_NEOID|nr:hypothetical protein NEOLI_001476 [Neolecta irregularis DAH-3]|eukprot:OLL26297.1 hypothetical protein NEOLI_001476 [Neolecta irregularis DAH-3]